MIDCLVELCLLADVKPFLNSHILNRILLIIRTNQHINYYMINLSHFNVAYLDIIEKKNLIDFLSKNLSFMYM